jgi:protein-S-isoprenylcysteine O-methyltransferase Ste14
MNHQKRISWPRVIVIVVFFVIGIPLLPLLVSMRWGWWEAWVYASLCIAGFAISRMLAVRRSPDLLVERAGLLDHADTKTWDKVLSPLVGLGSGLIPLVAGIDARFEPLVMYPLAVKLLALVVMLAGYALGAYALIENRYFSGVVRIQADRGHRVVTGGPYRWVRHPGYAGALLTYLATPFLLDSNWAFVPVALITVVLFIRTGLEDKTLQNELAGYRAYAGRTHYRLIPGIW